MDIKEFVFLGTKAQALPYKCRRIDKRGTGNGKRNEMLIGRFESFKMYHRGIEINPGVIRTEKVT